MKICDRYMIDYFWGLTALPKEQFVREQFDVSLCISAFLGSFSDYFVEKGTGETVQ